MKWRRRDEWIHPSSAHITYHSLPLPLPIFSFILRGWERERGESESLKFQKDDKVSKTLGKGSV